MCCMEGFNRGITRLIKRLMEKKKVAYRMGVTSQKKLPSSIISNNNNY